MFVVCCGLVAAWPARFRFAAGNRGRDVRDDGIGSKNCENRPILADFFEKMADFCGFATIFGCKNALFGIFVVDLLEFLQKFNCWFCVGIAGKIKPPHSGRFYFYNITILFCGCLLKRSLVFFRKGTWS